MIGALERPAVGARADAQPVISMIDVGMTYPNGKVALADVNVSIPGGDFVFLVGPSGAGKSTFIRLLIREQLATSGRVSDCRSRSIWRGVWLETPKWCTLPERWRSSTARATSSGSASAS